MINVSRLKKLQPEFYLNDVVDVAPLLLGKIFVRKVKNLTLAGKIVEVEAYDGSIDQAAHSFNGMTERNRVMFLKGGRLYVYFTYGMHYCINVVTGEEGRGSAVLLRGIEPLLGLDKMKLNRFGNKRLTSNSADKEISNGPGKIGQAFQIDKKDNGIDLTGDEIFVAECEGIEADQIGISQRIGIKKSIELPWRFFIKENRFVSRI
jgi:DNA-3-methyladenine glycosylase